MRPMNRLLNTFATAPLVLLVLLVNAAVIGRYVFASPIRWTEEVSGILMIWLVMLGALVAERDAAHLRIPVLLQVLPKRLSRGVGRGIALLSIVVLGAFTWLGWVLASSVSYKVTDLLRISYWWIDIALCVGFGGMAVLMLLRLIRSLRAPGSDEEYDL